MSLLLLRLRFYFFFAPFFLKKTWPGERCPLIFVLRRLCWIQAHSANLFFDVFGSPVAPWECWLFFSAWKGMFILLDFFIRKWGIWCNHVSQLPEPVAQITISLFWTHLWSVSTSAGDAHSSSRPRKISLLDSLVSLDSVVWRFGRFVWDRHNISQLDEDW